MIEFQQLIINVIPNLPNIKLHSTNDVIQNEFIQPYSLALRINLLNERNKAAID